MDIKQLEQKKTLLDSHRPLPPELINNLQEWFDIELTYTSNAIEGNTLTRQETALVVEKGLTVKGKPLKDHLEATNHTNALHLIKSLVNLKPSDLTESQLLEIHASVLKGIDDPHAGKYRKVSVRIAGSTVVFPSALKVPDLMHVFMQWVQSIDLDPLTHAAMAHYKLVSIHPFIDGNGRTARLLMNLILMMSGYPPAIIKPEDRLDYINALESAQLGGTLDPFIDLILQAVDNSLDIYLDALSN